MLFLLVFLSTPALAASGVTATEVTVGTHLDLSGPQAPVGIAVRNGLQMAFGEIDAKGGVNGRMLRLVVADNGYKSSRAIAATKTTLTPDKIFAVLCPVGTPPVAGAMPIFVNAGILHLFPFTSADDTYVPSQPLEFAADLPVAQQMRIGLRDLLTLRGDLRVGALTRDDAFGRAALAGVTAEMARQHLRPAGTATFAPGASSVSRQLARLRADGAEIVVLGGVAQEAFAAMRAARARGWFPVFLCPSACYVPQVPTLGGRAVSGLYAVATTPIPYPDDPALGGWVDRYEHRYGGVASADALRAYLDARLFAAALARTGADPTQAGFARALETMPVWRDPDYGGVPVAFSPGDHLGFHSGFLAQIRGGRWIVAAPASMTPTH